MMKRKKSGTLRVRTDQSVMMMMMMEGGMDWKVERLMMTMDHER